MWLCSAHHAYEPAESNLEVWDNISEGVMGSALDDQQYSPTTLAAIGSLLPGDTRQHLKVGWKGADTKRCNTWAHRSKASMSISTTAVVVYTQDT